MNSYNGVMMQYFHWYINNDGSLWNELKGNVPSLAAAGITSFWLPPFCKGSGGFNDVGYGVYDLFDIGEFDQKGAIRTKYGTKDQLLEAINEAQKNGIHCYADIVFNHKDGGDDLEYFDAQEIDWDDRNKALSNWHQIAAYTKFVFKNRGNAYSSMKWDYNCFDALTYNAYLKNNDHLFRIKDKHFSTEVSPEHENDDYLMANDLDTSYEPVKQELLNWGKWLFETTAVNGFRIDACKHIKFSFFDEWLTTMRTLYDQEFFSVGEYWSSNVEDLHTYIGNTGGIMSLFDAPLHYKFHDASNAGASLICGRYVVIH